MPHLLMGCSFTDPRWQKTIPWSVCYSKMFESYIGAQAGMGIKGISTEALCILKQFSHIDKVIVMLPTLWRMDIELDYEAPPNVCNAMMPVLHANKGEWKEHAPASRKWLISGGLHFDKNTKTGSIFDFLYQHQGFFVLLKEQIQSLKLLLDYCKFKDIPCYITAIQDPKEQLQGLDDIKNQIDDLLKEVEYDKWLKFDKKFVNKFLGHDVHPSSQEHEILCKRIINLTN